MSHPRNIHITLAEGQAPRRTVGSLLTPLTNGLLFLKKGDGSFFFCDLCCSSALGDYTTGVPWIQEFQPIVWTSRQ